MTDLERLKQWLLSYPDWERGKLMYIDFTDAVPGNAGLFPVGLEEVGRKRDITGRVTVENRYHFALYRVSAGEADNMEEAQWLLGFQNWVQSQCAAGLAPTFGAVPRSERIQAEMGKRYRVDQVGTGIYMVRLTASFIRIYEVD